MSGVRVLVGTRRGAFVLSSDGRRERWDVSGPPLTRGLPAVLSVEVQTLS